MQLNKVSVDDINVKGKKVLVAARLSSARTSASPRTVPKRSSLSLPRLYASPSSSVRKLFSQMTTRLSARTPRRLSLR